MAKYILEVENAEQDLLKLAQIVINLTYAVNEYTNNPCQATKNSQKVYLDKAKGFIDSRIKREE